MQFAVGTPHQRPITDMSVDEAIKHLDDGQFPDGSMGPKVRAADTARLACKALGREPETADELGGGAFDALALSAGRGEVLLVGHEPDFSAEVGRLTGANVKLKKGGLAVVDGSTLLALLRPKELAAIAGGS